MPDVCGSKCSVGAMVLWSHGGSMAAWSVRQTCCARYRGAAKASRNSSDSVSLAEARFPEPLGRTSPPTLHTFSATSWRTRVTIGGRWSCWRGNWDTGCPQKLPPDSGNGLSERENVADAERADAAAEARRSFLQVWRAPRAS